MEENFRVFLQSKKIRLYIVIVIILLILLAGFFVYNYFIKQNNYRIENKYYNFKLQAPRNWIAEENTSYSENNIAKVLSECKNDKSSDASVYEIGAFRFKNQRYPQDFGISGPFAADLPSGVILEITVNCIPDSIKDKIINYNYSNLKIGGEKTFEEFLNLPGFGKTEQLSFLYNNFQYRVKEYIYISPGEKENSEKLIKNYTGAFNKIISSFKFIN